MIQDTSVPWWLLLLSATALGLAAGFCIRQGEKDKHFSLVYSGFMLAVVSLVGGIMGIIKLMKLFFGE